eukprot:gene8480-9348_t
MILSSFTIHSLTTNLLYHKRILRLTFRQFSSCSSFLPKEDTVTIGKAHQLATKWLESREVIDAEDSSRHLLSAATLIGTKYSDFVRNQERELSSHEVVKFERFCWKRAERCPVQYIIGNWDFYGLTFTCRPPILIPRPETEELVEKVVKDLQLLPPKKCRRILDIGTGSGVIGVTLASQLSNSYVLAIDSNPVAVQLANENAQSILGKESERFECKEIDYLNFAQDQTYLGLFDIIVSNPPYIPSGDLPGLMTEVREYEDKRALDGGLDGFDLIKEIIINSERMLSIDGSRKLWLEVDPSHPQLLKDLLAEKHFPRDVLESIRNVESFRDLSGNQRFICITYR